MLIKYTPDSPWDLHCKHCRRLVTFAHVQAAEVAALLQWLGAELPQLPDAERIEAIRWEPVP